MPFENLFDYAALVSVNTVCGDVERNAQTILTAVRECHEKGCGLVLFPQMAFTGLNLGHLMRHRLFIEHVAEKFDEFRSSLPSDITVGIGLPLVGSNYNIYDCYVFLRGRRILSIDILCHEAEKSMRDFYAHTSDIMDLACNSFLDEEADIDEAITDLSNRSPDFHQHSVPRYLFLHKEKVAYGSAGVRTLTLKKNKKSFNIRFGIYGSHALYKDSTDQGMDVLFNPLALTDNRYNNLLHYNILLLSKFIFSLYVSVNLSGNENGSCIYDGQCFATDAKGNAVVSPSKVFSFDNYNIYPLTGCEKTQLNPDNQFTVGAHIMTSEEPQLIFKGIALGLFDYMVKTKSRGYCISLSGGADSALCASAVIAGHAYALCELQERYFDVMRHTGVEISRDLFDGNIDKFIRKHVAPKILTAVYQGSQNSSDTTYNVAKALAEDLGCTFYSWSIDSAVNEYVKTVGSTDSSLELTFEKNDLAMQSIQARSRVPGLWLLTNVQNRLLIATSNASEAAVGYCTMDGDTAGSISPIGAIPKSLVLDIISCIGHKGVKLEDGTVFSIDALSPLSDMAPTAELRPGGNQRDEDDLMPYPELDEILNHISPSPKPLDAICYEIADLQIEGKNGIKDAQEIKDDIRRFMILCLKAQWKRERLAPAMTLTSSGCPRYPVLNGALDVLLSELDRYNEKGR